MPIAELLLFLAKTHLQSKWELVESLLKALLKSKHLELHSVESTQPPNTLHAAGRHLQIFIFLFIFWIICLTLVVMSILMRFFIGQIEQSERGILLTVIIFNSLSLLFIVLAFIAAKRYSVWSLCIIEWILLYSLFCILPCTNRGKCIFEQAGHSQKYKAKSLSRPEDSLRSAKSSNGLLVPVWCRYLASYSSLPTTAQSFF